MCRVLVMLLVCVIPALAGAEDVQPFKVPYRLTLANHVLIRARLNGKGPYHFLMDTGAPTLFVATAVGRKLGVQPDAKGVGMFDRMEIEGGVVLEKVSARIEDPYQIEGMNKLGLAGEQLHGVIGYNLLARFRIELDLTRDKMTWTPLNFKPLPPPEPVKGGMPAEVEALGSLSNLLIGMIGKKVEVIVQPRGFFGVELADADGTVAIKAVLPKSPAATAGLQAGDVLLEIQGRKVRTSAEVQKLTAPLAAGQVVRLTIRRGEQAREFTITPGKGL